MVIGMKKSYDRQKSIEALVYVTNKQHDLYAALKVFYFADKEHLRLFGRQMFNEVYYALKKGPIPSTLYDFLKCVRGDGRTAFNPEVTKELNKSLTATRKTVHAKRESNLEFLSKSEIQCLEFGLLAVAEEDFGTIKNKSHDAAYLKTRLNDPMVLEEIIGTLPNSEMVFDYINT
jgi:uncharacterized phage-associated protein